jgi:hypothetical protein
MRLTKCLRTHLETPLKLAEYRKVWEAILREPYFETDDRQPLNTFEMVERMRSGIGVVPFLVCFNELLKHPNSKADGMFSEKYGRIYAITLDVRMFDLVELMCTEYKIPIPPNPIVRYVLCDRDRLDEAQTVQFKRLVAASNDYGRRLMYDELVYQWCRQDNKRDYIGRLFHELVAVHGLTLPDLQYEDVYNTWKGHPHKMYTSRQISKGLYEAYHYPKMKAVLENQLGQLKDLAEYERWLRK